MLQNAMNSKLFKTTYRVVLPVFVLLLLLVFASFNERPKLFGSGSIDLIIRFILTIWFCSLFIKLSRFSSFSFFPNKKCPKTDVGGMEKYFYIGIIILFSLGCGVITWWIIRWFLPDFSDFAFVITSLNTMIVFIPMVAHYWVIKL